MNEVLLVLALMLGFTAKRTSTLSVTEVYKDTPGARWEPCFEGGWQSLGDTKHVPCTAYTTIRGAWVRTETNEERAIRLRSVATMMVTVATENQALWPGSVHEFAMAMTSASGWSTGFREDIQRGRARGPDGEVCLADATEATARQFSDAELAKLPKRALLGALVGTSPEALHACLTVLARGLANARQWAAKHCARLRQPVLESAFAVYGTGGACVTHWRLDWNPEGKRFATWRRWTPRLEPVWPAWYSAGGTSQGVTVTVTQR